MRKALIIGNGNYLKKEEKLNNPINDAKGMEGILSYKGFETIVFFDLTEEQMKSNFDIFTNEVSEGDDVVFFFAGHGIEDRDTNYILSINYTEKFNLDTSLTIDKIQNSLYNNNNNGIKIIIIDTCRDNKVQACTCTPEKIKVNNNTFVAFSTSSGNVAKDGAGKNSYYTESLINNIKSYNLSIYDIFSRTREKVLHKTNYAQVPWEHSSLLESWQAPALSNMK